MRRNTVVLFILLASSCGSGTGAGTYDVKHVVLTDHAIGETGHEVSGPDISAEDISDHGYEVPLEVVELWTEDIQGPVFCTPGPPYCSGNQRVICEPDGTVVYEDCGDQLCFEGKCLSCLPGQMGCLGYDVARCTDDGSAWILVESCDPDETGRVCKAGKCVSQCEASGPRTNAGCEYWPLDLDQNYEYDAENMQFAVIVSNLSSISQAKVTIFKDGNIEKQVYVPKNDLAIILLDPYNIDTPGIAAPDKLLSRRLVSTVPIVAYQFNPLENVGVYSNDASLLLPTNALGLVYRVMSWPQRSDAIASYFTVVPVDQGTTYVKITVTAPTMDGPGLIALSPGDTTTVELQQGQVLHVKARNVCSDLTGSLVVADKRVMVMGGHECANIPIDAKCSEVFCCCDHLEEQLFPVDTWGKHYIVSRLYARGQAPDTVRILAAKDSTKVSVDGANVAVPMLDAGKFYDFRITSDVDITANEPILVAQFMEGQTSPTGCSATCETVLFTKRCDGDPFGKICNTDEDCCPGVAGIGDPAMILAVPVEQYREDYVFLVPNKYAKNYVNIIAPLQATVMMDGVPVASFVPVASSGFAVAKIPVSEGVHRILANAKTSVIVYGWDQYVSYGYAGGMNLNTLTTP